MEDDEDAAEEEEETSSVCDTMVSDLLRLGRLSPSAAASSSASDGRLRLLSAESLRPSPSGSARRCGGDGGSGGGEALGSTERCCCCCCCCVGGTTGSVLSGAGVSAEAVVVA